MKVNINGKTPLERLTNFTKKVMAVPKHEIEMQDKKWKQKKSRRHK